MRKIFVSFTTTNYDFPQYNYQVPQTRYNGEEILIKNKIAKEHGFQPITWYTVHLKATKFYEENKEILDRREGFGCWLWKPFIIHECMKQCLDGDIVFYIDAGSSAPFPNNINEYIDYCKNNKGVYFVKSHHPNRRHVKADCYHFMGCEGDNYYDSLQVNSSFLIFEKNDLTMQVVDEWVRYGCNKNIITSDNNICGKDEPDGYDSHRFDQSIISLLKVKYDLPFSDKFIQDIKSR